MAMLVFLFAGLCGACHMPLAGSVAGSFWILLDSPVLPRLRLGFCFVFCALLMLLLLLLLLLLPSHSDLEALQLLLRVLGLDAEISTSATSMPLLRPLLPTDPGAGHLGVEHRARVAMGFTWR